MTITSKNLQDVFFNNPDPSNEPSLEEILIEIVARLEKLEQQNAAFNQPGKTQ